MENENLIIKDDISNEEKKNLIYTIRGKQVMLDSDVAMLYHYQTKRINAISYTHLTQPTKRKV